MNLPSKYCHNCGKQIPPAAKFCPHCGTSQASIDEKPPVEQVAPKKPMRTTAATTFRPMASDGDDDDDDVSIKADRVNSIYELGVTLSAIEVDVSAPVRRGESVASLMQQGGGMSPGYIEPGRTTPQDQDAKIVLAQIQSEGGTLRKE